MANKKLLDKAGELGLTPVDGESDEDLLARINDAQNRPDPSDGGAAAPTADDSADKPEHDLVNVGPDPDGHVNTTENTGEMSLGQAAEEKARRRELTDEDKSNIVSEFNQPGASVANIAAKYDLSGEEVFNIVDEHNVAKAEAKA